MFIEFLNKPVPPLTRKYVKKNLLTLKHEPDFSLASLAFALLKPRYNNYSGMYGELNNTFLPFDDILAYANAQKGRLAEGCINPCLVYLTYSDGTTQLRIENLKEAGFEELVQVNAFVKQSFNGIEYDALTNKDLNMAVVYSNTSSVQTYHLTIAFFAALFPKLFEDKSLSREEVDAMKALLQKTSTKFITQLSSLLSFIRTEVLKDDLAECFRGFRVAKVDSARMRLTKLEQDMDAIMAEFRKLCEQREDAAVQLEGLLAVSGNVSEQEAEVIDYVSTNPRLHNVEYSNSGILSVDVDSLLTNFDVAKWRHAMNRNDIYNGYHLSENNPFNSHANRKLFLDALFNSNDPELSIRLRGHFDLDISRSYLTVPRGEPFDAVNTTMKNAITNPHFMYHGCPGQNRDQIVSCLRESDIVSALECCIAATGSVNISETEITFRPFIQNVLTNENKIIHRADGTDMTTTEALLWLLKKQGENVA